MNLYLVHCGFYEEIKGHKSFENHTNFFVVAKDMASAKKAAKENPQYKSRKMHIDSLMEIKAVDGYKITPTESLSQDDEINFWSEA